MTDKQIIIDGVDVSGCEFYHDGKCLCEFTEINRKIFRYYSCNKFPDCYYKQLKRKEQECKRLKHDNGYEVGALEKTIDNLKSENKHLNDLLNQALKELEKTRETLTEIKEIAETAAKCMYATYSDDYTEGYRWLGSIILQKISEVEDEK